MLYTLLDTTGTSRFPLINHKVISWVENGKRYMMHTPRRGTPVIESAEEFIKSGRKIKSISFKEINRDARQYHEVNKNRKFNLLNYNCEHFYNGFVNNKEYSPQLIVYGLFAIYAGYKLIKNNEK